MEILLPQFDSSIAVQRINRINKSIQLKRIELMTLCLE